MAKRVTKIAIDGNSNNDKAKSKVTKKVTKKSTVEKQTMKSQLDELKEQVGKLQKLVGDLEVKVARHMSASTLMDKVEKIYGSKKSPGRFWNRLMFWK